MDEVMVKIGDFVELFFINEKGLAKLEIALCQGKHDYDKRQSIREKEDKRMLDREFKVR